MNVRMKTGIAIILVLSAALGWWRASTNINKASDRGDNWQALLDKQTPSVDYKKVAEQIRSASIFPAAYDPDTNGAGAQSANGITSKSSKKSIPPFPKITGMTKIDRKKAVILILADNRVISARVGDVIESGWEIASVNSTMVKASYDGKLKEFPILNYDRKIGKEEFIQALKEQKKANKYKKQ